MITSRRVVALIALCAAFAALWAAFGPSEWSQQAEAQQPAAGQQEMRANLNKAAESIVAAAEQVAGLFLVIAEMVQAEEASQRDVAQVE